MTITQLLRHATTRLASVSPTARLDAELLLAHTLGWSRARLIAERTHQPTPGEQAAFEALIERRANLEPIAYIVGHKEFYGLDLEVTPATLIPRPETELLVELAMQLAHKIADPDRSISIADIGTGSGAIAIALACQLPNAQLYATDLSPAALAVAARNLARYGLEQRIQLLQGDLLSPLPGPVDMIVSNPPYTILAEVDANVRVHEPHLALDGGTDGAMFYRRLIPCLRSYIRPGGGALFEIGAWQAAIIAPLIQTHLPQATIAIYRDLADRDRVVVIEHVG